MPPQILRTYRYCYDDDYKALIWADVGFLYEDDEASFNHHIVISLGAPGSTEDGWYRAVEMAVNDSSSAALGVIGDDARFQLLRLDDAGFVIFSFLDADAVDVFRAHDGPTTREMLFGASEPSGRGDR